MKIGKLRHRITIQEYTVSQDSYGAGIESWADRATAYASVSPISGKELYTAQQLHAEVTTKITMRYMDGITPKMRVFFNSRSFEILSVLNFEERNVELNLLCKELV